MSNGQLKLVVIISADSDANRLMKALIGRGYPATKISSTGGFLHRGNATILSGVEPNEVDEVFALVRAECHARTEYVPVQTLPFFSEGANANLWPDEDFEEVLKRLIPLGRFGTVDEVAAQCLHMLSPASSWMTGECVVLDGGSSLPRNFWEPGTRVKRDG